MRSLPYLITEWGDQDAQATPLGLFANWNAEVSSVNEGKARVVRLTSTQDDFGRFLLNTELGVIYRIECEGEVADRSFRRMTRDDPYDYFEEDEAEWRAEGKAWEITDFF
ncbi:uncharacterized protein N0V89_008618 [Didymosphaeria variabile]|uniref:Uncharacterized protein n=1 Tax=Didymosphaeria variabile TaxID=1932322 RepID=A0A9W8XHW5_9PLEO|nr:uncharacterized protein N0V89_008618 [Didymosphaeria variabile]KAJ4349997.1 hypothetical protein N0V89_008618 [Didymosphaeria variabile]